MLMGKARQTLDRLFSLAEDDGKAAISIGRKNAGLHGEAPSRSRAAMLRRERLPRGGVPCPAPRSSLRVWSQPLRALVRAAFRAAAERPAAPFVCTASRAAVARSAAVRREAAR